MKDTGLERRVQVEQTDQTDESHRAQKDTTSERGCAYAFKFRTMQGDTALMISEGNETFWRQYGDNITIIGWSE
jgi:hypothetical protein